MLKLRYRISFICIIIAIISVLLTIKIPIIKESIGTRVFSIFNYNYNGIYSVVALVVSLLVFFKVSKNIENIFLNRLKMILSILFFISLVSVVLIK